MFFSSFRIPKVFSALHPVLAVLTAAAAMLLIVIAALLLSSQARVLAVRTGFALAGAEIAQDIGGFTNVLLLGTGGAGHDGGDLTDTMILASIDPLRTRSAVLLSLPRDLYVRKVGKTTVYGRINALFFLEKSRLERAGLSGEDAVTEALAAVGKAIGAQVGVPIHGVVQADFTAFTQAVDALGGVTIDVPAPITDYRYPLTETRVGVFRIGSGTQLLDGETALRYARSRYSTSDFDRSARQQQILAAMADAVRERSPVGQGTLLLQLLRDLEGHVHTTLSWQQILGLAQIASALSPERLVTMQLTAGAGGDGVEAQAGGFVVPGDPALFEGASVLLPAAPGGLDDWSRIRTFAQLLFTERTLYLDPPLIALHATPAARQQAWRLRNELLRHGLPVLPLATDATLSGSVLRYASPRRTDAAAAVADLTGLRIERSAALSGSGVLRIEVDRDFRFVPFADAAKL